MLCINYISIDFALMEKADRVLNFEASFDWDDVGSWISVGKYLQQDEVANAANTTLITEYAAVQAVCRPVQIAPGFQF